MAGVDSKQMDEWIKEVYNLCPHVPKDAIKKDLMITKSAEQTINRIFDGLIDLVTTDADGALTDEIPEEAYNPPVKSQVIVSPKNKNMEEIMALIAAESNSGSSISAPKPIAGVTKVHPKNKPNLPKPKPVLPKITSVPALNRTPYLEDEETLINRAIQESLKDTPSPVKDSKPIVAVTTVTPTATQKKRGRKPKTTTIHVAEPAQPPITSLLTPQKSVDSSVNVSYNLDELLGKYGTPFRDSGINDSNASEDFLAPSVGDYDVVYLNDAPGPGGSIFPRPRIPSNTDRRPIAQSTPSGPVHTMPRLAASSSSVVPEFIIDDDESDESEVLLKRNNTARRLSMSMDLDDSIIDLTDNVNFDKVIRSAWLNSKTNPGMDQQPVEEINDSQEDAIMAVDYDDELRSSNSNNNSKNNNMNRANEDYFDYVPDEMGLDDYETYNNVNNNVSNNNILKSSTASLKQSTESTKSTVSDGTKKKSSTSAKSKEKSPTSKAAKKKNDKQALEDLTVLLDRRLLEQQGGADILTHLQKNNCKTQILDLKLANTILWKRKTQNEETEEVVESDEKFVLIKISANDLATLIMNDILMKHYDMTKTTYPEYRIVYIIEGLDAYLKEGVSLKSASIRNMVISMSDAQVPIPPPTNNKKKKQDGERRLMRKDFDEALLVLQIEKGCSIRKTVDAAETADTIYRFTSSISQIPYKKQEPAFETFCAESASSGRKSAKTVYDAWIAQLEQINSVSRQVAEAIARRYPTLRSLVNVYLAAGMTEREKKSLLAEVRVEGLGGVPGRKIGPAISEKIYRVFTETNSAVKIN